MSKRKSLRQKAPTAWPYTPEPSPRLGPSALPVDDIKDIRMDEPARPRPISMARSKEGILSPNRPTLEEVLNNTAPQPYTLAAYTAFLSQQHCLETLEFVTEARRYTEKYDEAALELTGMPLTSDTDQGFELTMIWNRILDIYVKPGAPREINLPAEERDDLVEYPYEPRPPPPSALEPSVKRMYDLMSDSIFIPFCNSLKIPSHAQTFNALSDWSREGDLEPGRLTYDERTGVSRRVTSRRKESPPNTSSSHFSPSRSPPSQHRPTHSSSLSNALNRASGNNRLSTLVSNSSAVSESALTDSSEGGGSPGPLESEAVMTPPTTPPTSELGGPHVSHAVSAPTTHPVGHPPTKSHRSESGAWKKTMKFFGGGSNKKKDTS